MVVRGGVGREGADGTMDTGPDETPSPVRFSSAVSRGWSRSRRGRETLKQTTEEARSDGLVLVLPLLIQVDGGEMSCSFNRY